MKSATKDGLAKQREALRQRIQAQRQLLAQQLEPAPTVISRYPRSMTMRFLTSQPALAARLLTEFAEFTIGVRHARQIATVLTVAGILRSVASSR